MKIRFLLSVLCAVLTLAAASPLTALAAPAPDQPVSAPKEQRQERKLAGEHGENRPVDLGKDDPAKADESGDGGGGSGGGSIVRMLFGLVIVVGVIYAVQWVLKRTRGSLGNSAKGRGLDSRATLPLGTGRALHLVQVGDELVLVGTAESSVTALRTWTGEEAQEILEATAPSAPPAPEATNTEHERPDVAPGEKATAFPTAGETFKKVLDDLRSRTVRK